MITSCKQNKGTTIVGDVTGIPASKVYLIDITDSNKKLDSAKYDGKKFVFNLFDKFDPFLASIIYFNEENRKTTLLFSNHELSTKSSKLGTSAFMLDDGEIKISGSWKVVKSLGDEELLNIQAGKQNIYYQKNIANNIGYINVSNSNARIKSLKMVKSEVLENPWSFYLLNGIYSNRNSYTKNEFNELYKLFDDRVKNSKMGIILKEYFLNRPNEGDLSRTLDLRNINNVLVKDITRKAKLNMVIFWASWCLPCRNEIPYLKQLRKSIKTNDFYMASVSIDDNLDKWIKAVDQKNMDWDQFIVQENELMKTQAQFKFNAIPLIVLTDKEGREIKRLEGFNSNKLSELQMFIGNNIK
ncbi:TlpA family protein disulfide reductase [Sphingobacterium ginsenosidimutans]|uniref:Thioredoxin domain-containing protein n=1 Tax=Sphingobacterium ginsenosidimutans TaxID=687845 RepID=A0ABP7ZWA8_9SPHI